MTPPETRSNVTIADAFVVIEAGVSTNAFTGVPVAPPMNAVSSKTVLADAADPHVRITDSMLSEEA